MKEWTASRRTGLTAALALALGAGGVAVVAQPAAQTASPASSAQAGMGGADMMSMMGTMGSMSVASEADYLARTVEHHRQTVRAARALLAGNPRPALRDFARALLQTRAAELVKLEGWLARWYPGRQAGRDGAGSMDGMMGSGQGAMSSGQGAGGTGMAMGASGAGAGMAAMGSSGAGMTAMVPGIRDLGRLKGEALERAFLADLIPHEMRGAMLDQALLGSGLVRRDELYPFAAGLSRRQRSAALQLASWRVGWFGEGGMMGMDGVMGR